MANAEPRVCSIARTLDVVGEKWALLAVREVFLGNRTFDQMVRRTGAPRDTLAARLRTLTGAGILERRQYSEHPARFEYHLTAAGPAAPVRAPARGPGDLPGLRGTAARPRHRTHHRARDRCQLAGARRAVRNSSTSSSVVVASSGALSSRHRPVNRGKRMASPASGLIRPQAAV